MNMLTVPFVYIINTINCIKIKIAFTKNKINYVAEHVFIFISK
jgi:hypothetical protein